MPLTKSTRSTLLKTIMGLTAMNYGTSGTYLALSTTAINADGTGITEPGSGTGYARQNLKLTTVIGSTSTTNVFPNDPTYDSGNDKYTYTSIADVVFPEVQSAWGTVTHFAIYTQATGGTMLAYGTLTSSITPVVNTVPVIRAGQLIIEEE